MSKRKKQKVSFDLKKGHSKYALDTDPDDIKLPALITFVGARGSGKTYSCVALCRYFEQKKYVSRTFLISPTSESNDIYSNLKTLDSEKDVFKNPFEFGKNLEEVKSEIKNDWEKYELNEKYKKAYAKYMRDEYSITIEEEMLLDRHSYEKPESIPRPNHLLIVDDAQGTAMYSDSRTHSMTHMSIKHRHIPVTICFCVQSWTGLPRVLRLNSTQFVLFKTADKKQLIQMYEAFGNLVDLETFERMYKYCTSKPNGFMFIDTDPKSEDKRFRNGFNEFLVHHEK